MRAVGVAKAPIPMSCRRRIFETLASLDAGSGLAPMPLSEYSDKVILMDSESPKRVTARRSPQGMARPFQELQRRIGAFGTLPSGEARNGKPLGARPQDELFSFKGAQQR